ncbi:MAG: GNAT family N-acetyltransferase [Dehalococcoidales bacterium]|nr:GNAT family N-acetyltransferase [Dehalococcoidales bacterium]
MNEITLRKVSPDKKDTVFQLLKDSGEWLLEKGNDYWQVYIDLPPFLMNWIQPGFENDEFYFAENANNEIIGCFRLQDEDRMFWGERNEKAGYVHSFAISRKLAGQRTGYKVLAAIESHCRENGKEYLRLDCGTHLDTLRAYYEGFGFHFVADVHLMNTNLTLYEKKIT